MSERKYFGTDGMRGQANFGPDDRPDGPAPGHGGGPHVHPRQPPPSVVIGKDTRLSGYMLEPALIAGFISVGMDVDPGRPAADPGRRHADALPAGRSRRHDLGLAQPLSRTTASSCSAPTATSCRTSPKPRSRRSWTATARTGWPRRRPRPRQPARRRAAAATSSSSRAPSRGACGWTGCKIVVDCAHGAAYKVAPERAVGIGRRSVLARRRAERHQHQSTAAAPRTRSAARGVQASGADIGIALDGDADRAGARATSRAA